MDSQETGVHKISRCSLAPLRRATRAQRDRFLLLNPFPMLAGATLSIPHQDKNHVRHTSHVTHEDRNRRKPFYMITTCTRMQWMTERRQSLTKAALPLCRIDYAPQIFARCSFECSYISVRSHCKLQDAESYYAGDTECSSLIAEIYAKALEPAGTYWINVELKGQLQENLSSIPLGVVFTCSPCSLFLWLTALE